MVLFVSILVDPAGSELPRGKATRPGVYKCHAGRKQFRVTVGTLFERSAEAGAKRVTFPGRAAQTMFEFFNE